MAEKKEIVPPQYDVNAKWDACLDLTHSNRSPVTRWASVAFGAGVGIGSAYSDCSRIFDASGANLAPPKVTDASASQVGHD